MSKLWKLLKKWWCKMWGLEVFGDKGETFGGNGSYVGVVGEIREIPANTKITMSIPKDGKVNVFPIYNKTMNIITTNRGLYFKIDRAKNTIELNNTSQYTSFVTISFGV